MYSEQAFDLLLGFVATLEETDLADGKLNYEVEGSREVRLEFGEALLTILKGFLTSDADTQNLIYVTGLSNGLIEKRMIENIAEYARRRDEPLKSSSPKITV